MKKIVAGLLICLIFTLSGCITAKQKALDSGMQPLTNQDLKTFFSEKRTAKWVSKDGRTAIVTYLPDGSQSALGGDGKTYPGTYSFKDNMYCSKMDHRNGEVRCTEWFKVNEKTFELYTPSGSLGGKITFE